MIEEYKTIEYKGKVVFHKMKVTSPERDLKPFQDKEACFMFVKKGVFSVRTPDQFITFKEDQGLLAKCFNFFIETTKEQRLEERKMDFLGVFLFPSHVEDLLNLKLSNSNKTVDFNIKNLQIDKLLKAYRESIEILIENPDIADEQMIETKIREFVLLISKSQNMSPMDFLASMFKLNRTELEATIQNNLYSNLSVAQIAQLCAMSTSSFKRKFKETYNESPKKYMAKKKLEKAMDLLKNSSERISTIAYECGYDTISTFNRSFKLNNGISPSEFRLDQNA